MLDTWIGPMPVFCKVAARDSLVVPTGWGSKERVVGDSDAEIPVPMPLRGTVCVTPRFPESSVNEICPLTGPGTAGENVTFTVQLDPAANGPRQLEVWANTPLAETLWMFRVLPPKLVTVRGWGGLVLP